jgi:hypothetical protein
MVIAQIFHSELGKAPWFPQLGYKGFDWTGHLLVTGKEDIERESMCNVDF